MEKSEEKAIFDKATEKLDLYVPFLLDHNHASDAKEFLEPGGQYVRFAVKEFMKELLFELIKPVGNWTKDPYYIDMDPIYETVKEELAEHFEVSHGLEEYIFSEYVHVKIRRFMTSPGCLISKPISRRFSSSNSLYLQIRKIDKKSRALIFRTQKSVPPSSVYPANRSTEERKSLHE